MRGLRTCSKHRSNLIPHPGDLSPPKARRHHVKTTRRDPQRVRSRSLGEMTEQRLTRLDEDRGRSKSPGRGPRSATGEKETQLWFTLVHGTPSMFEVMRWTFGDA